MKSILTALLLLLIGGLLAFPITRYDYHTPGHNPSPVIAALGGLNLTESNDLYSFYDNPALLAKNTKVSLASSFQIKTDEELSAYDLMQVGNLLEHNQLSAIAVTSQKGGVMFQPLARIHLNENTSTFGNNSYYDYSMTNMQMSFGAGSEKNKSLSYGITLKYMYGRLVYLDRHNMEIQSFIDDKVNGVSTDLGFLYSGKSFTAGIAFYDLLSGLFWQTNENQHLTRRGALGFQLGGESSKLLLGSMTTIEDNPITTYHLGYAYDFQLSGTPEDKQLLALRTGVYSEKFDGKESIYYSFGSGYNYKALHVDFAIVSQGMEMNKSTYLFSVSMSK